MGERMRALDWSTTALPPLAQWPQSLRICVRILLASGYPMSIYWGPRASGHRRALAESRGRVSGPSGAAAKLGIPPSTVDRKIKALNINKKQFLNTDRRRGGDRQ
jgi:hypothetical protein